MAKVNVFWYEKKGLPTEISKNVFLMYLKYSCYRHQSCVIILLLRIPSCSYSAVKKRSTLISIFQASKFPIFPVYFCERNCKCCML